MIRRPPRSPLFPSTTLSRSLPPLHVLLGERLQDGDQGRVVGPGLSARIEDLVEAAPGCDPFHARVVSLDRKSTRLNSSHQIISYAVFCLKKKKNTDSRNQLC